MTDIQLTKPAANQTQTVTSASDARFVLDFNTGDAQLAKSENGENLIITFEDGAKIEVEGFYTAFNKDNLPTLSVNGQDITGDQLTAILGEDLMPAAGPAASGGPASAGGSNASFADPSLDGGINRLDGLDIGFPDEANLENTIEGAGALPDQSAGVAATTPEVTTVAATPEAPTVVAAPVTPAASTITSVAPAPSGTSGDPIGGGDTPTPPVSEDPMLTKPEATKDDKAAAIMDELSVEKFVDLDNDKNVTAIDSVGPLDTSSAPGLSATYDAGNLNLVLDAKGLEAALYDSDDIKRKGGDLKPGDNIGTEDTQINLAGALKTLKGEVSTTYKARDDAGQVTGEVSATFEVGNVAARETLGEGKDLGGSNVAWAASNYGTINTEGGNDLIIVADNKGGGKIDAGSNADRIYLGDNAGEVTGGAGNDKINVSGTNTGTISAGGGSDVITVNVNKGTIEGTTEGFPSSSTDVAKIDVIEGVAGSTIKGGEGSDYVTLRGGSSTIELGKGDDKVNLRGDDYHEEYVAEGIHKPGDGGHWWADATSRDGNGHLVIDNAKLAKIAAMDAHNVTAYGGAGNDALHSSDASNHNILYGDADNDKLEVFDLAHNNTLYGGSNETGKDTTGKDTLLARRWAHDNELYGEGGDDVLIAQEFAHGNALHGGADNDLLVVQGMSYSAKADGVDGETSANIMGDARDNRLYGDDGADRLFALSGAQDNLLHGGAGNDYLYAGNTGFFGSGASDTSGIFSGKINGEDVNSATVKGAQPTSGNVLVGGEGDDLFVAGDASILDNNYFHGGVGIDVLVAKGLDPAKLGGLVKDGHITGMEVIVTGLDSHTDRQLAHMNATSGKITNADDLLDALGGITRNPDGTFTLDGSWTPSGGPTTIPGSGELTYQQYSNKGGTIILVAKNIPDTDADPLTVSGWDTLAGDISGKNDADDTLSASDYASGHTLHGKDGDDVLTASSGATGNELYGDVGNDVLTATGDGTSYNILHGGTGNDVLSVNTRGVATKEIDVHHNELYGDAGSDTMTVYRAHDNTLHGGGDGDNLTAWGSYTTGNKLYGDAGDDVLEVGGGALNNTLDGGAGSDLFITTPSYATTNTFIGGDDGSLDVMAIDGGIDDGKLKDALDNGNIQGMEVIVTKGWNGTETLGKFTDGDGHLADLSSWNKTADFLEAGGQAYDQYSNGDLTILVAQSIVNNGGGA